MTPRGTAPTTAPHAPPTPWSATTQNNAGEQRISVRFSDCPEFSGKATEWHKFKNQFVATARAAGHKEILSVNDPSNRESRWVHDQDDTRKCEDIYSILQSKTATGTASGKVTKFEQEQDGALAWLALKDFYDQDGSKDGHGSTALKSLMNLQLECNTFGGMDKCISDFEKCTLQLEEADQPLTDQQKKTFFAEGINDQDYDAIKDNSDDWTHHKTASKLR